MTSAAAAVGAMAVADVTCSVRGGLLGHVCKGEGPNPSPLHTPAAITQCMNSMSPKLTALKAPPAARIPSAAGASHLRPGDASASAIASRNVFLLASAVPISSQHKQQQQQQRGFLSIAAAKRPTTHVARAAAGAAPVQEGSSSGSPPTPTPTAGVSVYKPASYDALISDATKAVMYALDAGKRRLEVDFPPLPSSISGYKGSSDEFIDANIQLAFTLARKLNQEKGQKTRIVFPDGPERRRALRVFKSALELTDCVTFGSLEDVPADVRGAARDLLGLIKGFFDFDFEEDSAGVDSSTPDVYIVIGATTNELPVVKEYIDHFAKDSPVILFNLETDTLRSDLGLFGFPSKDIHYKFLSQFQPVFYIRTRDYSKSIPVAPFILNYSGALFRQYPGPWQVMLKQGDGSYACVAENTERYTLFQTKEELLTSLGLQEEVGSTMAFLRSGYKTSTWWEENLELEESQDWRT